MLRAEKALVRLDGLCGAWVEDFMVVVHGRGEGETDGWWLDVAGRHMHSGVEHVRKMKHGVVVPRPACRRGLKKELGLKGGARLPERERGW